jgi:hypothetical protein
MTPSFAPKVMSLPRFSPTCPFHHLFIADYSIRRGNYAPPATVEPTQFNLLAFPLCEGLSSIPPLLSLWSSLPEKASHSTPPTLQQNAEPSILSGLVSSGTLHRYPLLMLCFIFSRCTPSTDVNHHRRKCRSRFAKSLTITLHV